MSKRRRAKITKADSSSSEKGRHDPWLKVVFALFFLSGMTALIYEVLWTRSLVLVFGASSFATSTVLSVFMAGLAIGAWICGRYIEKVQNRLLFYGILEGLIAVWALCVPFLFNAATPVYKMVWQHWQLEFLPFSIIRALMVALILLPPTVCMGATLPLLCKYVSERMEHIASRTGALYAFNTFGAVLGAGLAGFVFMPLLGLFATTILAAAINFGICVSAFSMSYSRNKNIREQLWVVGKADEETVSFFSKLPFKAKATLLMFAVSGALAMIYEVVWTRNLQFLVGSSTYAFTIMLVSFLLGIFLGSAGSAVVADKAKRPIWWLAIIQFALAGFTFLAVNGFNTLPFLDLVWSRGVIADADTLILLRFFLAGLVLLPISVCLGAIFPLVVKAVTPDLSALGKSIGVAYALNTVGAICGALLAGFVLLPAFGAQPILIAGAITNCLLALILVLSEHESQRPVQWGVTAAASAAIVALTMASKEWDSAQILTCQTQLRSLKTSSAFQAGDYEQWRKAVQNSFETTFCKEGISCNVAVVRSKAHNVQSLITAGEIDGSDGPDMGVQVALAAYPLFFARDPQDVAMIGWGTGVTAGSASLFPVKTITAIELEPQVVQASRLFNATNHRAEEDKRVRLVYNDGRNYLAASDAMFDVIISEPSNPWRSGVCNLFTSEYFKLCRQHLRKGGVMCLWLQTVEIPPEQINSVLAALHQSFPHLIGMMPNAGTLVVLASDETLKVNGDRIRNALTNETLKNDLRAIGVSSPEQLCAQLEIDEKGMQALASAGVANSDDKNNLEYSVARYYAGHMFVKDNMIMFDKHSGMPWNQVEFHNMSNADRHSFMDNVAKAADGFGNPTLAARWRKAAEENAR